MTGLIPTADRAHNQGTIGSAAILSQAPRGPWCSIVSVLKAESLAMMIMAGFVLSGGCEGFGIEKDRLHSLELFSVSECDSWEPEPCA